MNEAKIKLKILGKLMMSSAMNLGNMINEAAAVFELIICQQALINSLLTYKR